MSTNNEYRMLFCAMIIFCVLLSERMLEFTNFFAKPNSQSPSQTLLAYRNPVCQKPKLEVGIVIFASENALDTDYKRSLGTIRCYAERMGYRLGLGVVYIGLKKFVDSKLFRLHILTNGRHSAKSNCSYIQPVMFRRHCVLAWFMENNANMSWVFNLDADAGVVNPDHCIEDYIHTDVDMIFYERFFNWEIAAGGWIFRNNHLSRAFLAAWAAQWNVAKFGITSTNDNLLLGEQIIGVVYQDEILRNDSAVLACLDLRRRQKNAYQPAYPHVYCVNQLINQRRKSAHIYVYPRAHGWMLDRHLTPDLYTNRSFFQHGWKVDQISDQRWAMAAIPTGAVCVPGSRQQWPTKSSHYRNETDFRRVIVQAELQCLHNHRHFNKTQEFGMVRQCWPNCRGDENLLNLSRNSTSAGTTNLLTTNFNCLPAPVTLGLLLTSVMYLLQ